MISLADNIIEVLSLKHVWKNASSIKVILFGSVRSKLFDQLFNDLILFPFNFSRDRFFEVVVLDVKELV